MLRTLALTLFVGLLCVAILTSCQSKGNDLGTGDAAQAGPTQAPQSNLYPFAMCSNGNMMNNPAYAPAMLNAGAKMCRVDMSFSSVRATEESDPEKWNWKDITAVRALRTKNPDLEFLPILGYGASWAVDAKYKGLDGLTSINSPQTGINIMPADDPKNLYGHHVYEMVKRNKDIVTYWESWNEPDLPGYAFFRGSGKDFFAYQKACYLAAKKADPKCKVLFAGLSFASPEGYLATHKLQPPTPYPPKECFFEDYLRECVKDPDAKKNNYYFDIMNQHSYSRASDLYDYATILNTLMMDYLGEVKPIWITEMGITDGGAGGFGGTADDYCDYILQSYAWGKFAGIERFFHFQLDNSNGHGLYKGMLGEPKPALTTYRDVLVKEFADTKFVKQLHGSKGVDFLAGNSAFKPTWKAGYNAFEFQSNDGKKRVVIAFADTNKAVEVKFPATKGKNAVLIDRHNTRTPLTATDGIYTLTLPGAENEAGWPSFKDNKDAVALGEPEHLVGGPTQVIVEE